VLAPGGDPAKDESPEAPARRPIYVRLLIGAAVAGLFWALSPHLPHDQTLVFELGEHAANVGSLDVQWESASGEHEGKLTLNFPAPTPGRVVRQFRMTDGDYAFRITAVHRDATQSRTELVRQVTLDGNNITLRLDELSP
jgi:hypothetical protein